MEIKGNNKRINFWEGIIEKIKKMLDKWKGKFLSLEGRIFLLRFVLTSLSLFYMSFFKMPTSTVNTIKRVQRKFNNALLGKWIWCFFRQSQGDLWKEVLDSKYER